MNLWSPKSLQAECGDTGSDSYRSRNAVCPCAGPLGTGLAGSIHFFLTVFFDALNDGEDISRSCFDVGGEVHWIEAAAGGAKLDFDFFADFGAVESEHRKGQSFFNLLKAYVHFAAAVI